MTIINQSECISSTNLCYALIKFVFDFGSWSSDSTVVGLNPSTAVRKDERTHVVLN